MSRLTIVSIAFLLLCGAAALPAGARTATPDLAAFLKSLGSLDAGSSGPAPLQTAATRKGLRSITAFDVTCTATCGSDPSVSCTTSGSCSAVDRNCAVSQQGYVQCNGSYTWCPTVCACPEGDVMEEDWGCCTLGRQKMVRFTCIDGDWVRTGTTCSGSCY